MLGWSCCGVVRMLDCVLVVSLRAVLEREMKRALSSADTIDQSLNVLKICLRQGCGGADEESISEDVVRGWN